MNAKFTKLDKLLLAGVETFGDVESGGPPEMWEVLRSNYLEAPDRINDPVSYGIDTYTKEMQSKGKWFYMAAFQVSSFENLPMQMSAKLLPENEYAVFEYKGAISPKLGNLFQSIYKEWLPQSGYVQAGPYDLERYDQRFLGPQNPDSILEILIPVVKEK
ncbi:GyrI-like domain-containing protein [Microbulbifer epialgicus]|uniref:GyrI-like domain-containing protein n=1 Tax=Microbulbifer epialgicus TaxID=393907 RepID=A0ABV4NY88_9GAMM